MARAAPVELLEGERDDEAMLLHRPPDREVDGALVGALLGDRRDQRRVGGAVVVVADERDALAAAVLGNPHARDRVGDAAADAAPRLGLRKQDDRIVLGGALGGAAS